MRGDRQAGSRWRRAVLVAVALHLIAAPGCFGPKIPAGNLKELREKKRERSAAQRAAREATAPPQPEDASSPSPAPEAAPRPGAPTAVPPAQTGSGVQAARPAALPPGLAQVAVRTADGGAETLVLRELLVGHYERTYLSGGGVRDRERLAPQFVFREGLSLIVLKLKKIARVRWVAADPPTRTGVRLRFEFRGRREPVDLAAEDLLGAEHPAPPFLEGIDASGVAVRLPLFTPAEPATYRPIVDVVLGPGES